MDLEYLRAHPERLPMLIDHQRIRFTPVPGGSTSVAQRLTLDDGTDVFAKLHETGPEGLIDAERRGLDWLAAAGAPVPRVWASTPELLVTDWIPEAAPTADNAAAFGRALARLHRSGADRFGADWPGFIGRLPLDNSGAETDWAGWYATRRLLPYLRMSRDAGTLDAADTALVSAAIDRLPGHAGRSDPTEPVARIHGDLWPGNVLWSADRAFLIDPAAQGGHRETDLATLALWGGAPRLADIHAGYREVWPLADGWRDRTPAHQLHLLLVHTALFGRAYRDEVLAAARSW
ncbi:fructosamine-3-kinase [Stackebrandtia albiflava]|uniref:Fructosamine-3-kinase n=1 Tax=Stackebrandtia albiflava TaxID=406432 RepID=A0A562UYQ8_9ACTN|nr:fructosamine kinase family protein [Stackebrandtia albiflava]TWJ10770.1 fructosamine-3-kinase [Stackebrandtia albiflava]